NTPEADAICSTLQVFPADNPWNQAIDDWPVHLNSQKILGSIGADKPFRCNTDMGYVLVPPDQPKVAVRVASPAGSDPGPYPVPENVPIEGWPIAYQSLSLQEVQRRQEKDASRRAIVVDPLDRMLYEFFEMRKGNNGWECFQASIFDLKSNKLRPEEWPSV